MCPRFPLTSSQKAGLKASLFAVIVITTTYYSAIGLFFKAPRNQTVNVLIYWWPLILMWIPGLLSFIFWLVFHEGWRDIGLKPGAAKYWLLAIGVPFLMASITYMAAYLFGKASLNATSLRGPMFVDPFGILPSQWPAFTPGSLFTRLLIKTGVAATFGLIPEFIFALGEELGWRGYLQPRLIQSGLPFPLVIGGLIWSLWHLPWLMYPNALDVVLFIICITLVGIWIGRLRILSGSVWVAAMAHAAHNGFLLTLFASSFFAAPNWVSEAGMLPIIAYALIVLILMISTRHQVSNTQTQWVDL